MPKTKTAEMPEVGNTLKWVIGIMASLIVALLTLVVTLGSMAVRDIRDVTLTNSKAVLELTAVTVRLASEVDLRTKAAEAIHAQQATTDEKLTEAVRKLELLIREHLAKTEK